jgi:hypothetical protein
LVGNAVLSLLSSIVGGVLVLAGQTLGRPLVIVTCCWLESRGNRLPIRTVVAGVTEVAEAPDEPRQRAATART